MINWTVFIIMVHLKTSVFGELIELIKKAFEQTHTVSLAMQKYQGIEELIRVGNKKEIWDMLQEYLRQNASFINQFTWLTNLEVYKASPDYYDSVSVAELITQLRIAFRFSIMRDAFNARAKVTFKEKLKKMLLDSRLFTKEELRLLI